MEQKKASLWKNVLLVILVILIVILLLVLWRYNILTKIEKTGNIINDKSNLYYNLENSQMDNIIVEYWKKDSILKVNIKQINGNGDITFWKNTDTNEQYCFINNEKIYSTNTVGMLTKTPGSLIISNFSNFEKFLVAINPMFHIGSSKYDDKSCYYIKFKQDKEFIEKDTGLILYSSDNVGERKIKYTFNNVTDKDIEKPDISQYTLKEANS